MEQKNLTTRPVQIEHSCIPLTEIKFLWKLIRDYRPRKILAVDVNEEMRLSILSCIEEMQLNCQFEYCDGCSLGTYLEKTEDGIDFLVLNSVCNVPLELLNFIAVLPYLQQNAVIVLQDAVLASSIDGLPYASSILFQAVTAEKFPHNQDYYLDFRTCVSQGICTETYPQYSGVSRYAHIQFLILSAFRTNESTHKYIRDLFAALQIRWPFMPNTAYLNAYEADIAKHYSPDIVQLYQQAVHVTEQFFDPAQVFLGSMANSLFSTFRYVLLYGKGRWGHMFLDLTKKLGIQISGFVVSDGHSTEDCEGIPVFAFSRLPFAVNETLIIQTANSRAIEDALRQSKWHWIKFSDSFWAERGVFQE